MHLGRICKRSSKATGSLRLHGEADVSLRGSIARFWCLDLQRTVLLSLGARELSQHGYRADEPARSPTSSFANRVRPISRSLLQDITVDCANGVSSNDWLAEVTVHAALYRTYRYIVISNDLQASAVGARQTFHPPQPFNCNLHFHFSTGRSSLHPLQSHSTCCSVKPCPPHGDWRMSRHRQQLPKALVLR